MRGLVASRFNTTLLNYKKLQRLSLNNMCHWIHYKSSSCYINNQRSTVLSQFNNSSPYIFNDYYKLNNVKWFSLTNVLSKSKDRGRDKKRNHQTTYTNITEMAEVCNINKLTSEFERAIENLKHQFVKYASLRTTVGAIEEVPVDFEGNRYILQELAQISRNPKMIILDVSTFPQTIPTIVQSLSQTKMNLNPQQEGTRLYIPIPKVTKEHRQGLAKHAKALFIDCRDNIRNIRNKYVKALKTGPKIPEDQLIRVEGYITIMSRQYINDAEKLLQTKEKELLGDTN